VAANFDDCVRFANQHMICSVATCDREQPRVRMLGMWFADTQGFYFSTVKTKKIFRELTANRKAEVCFYTPPQGPLGQEGSTDIGTMMRASGDVVFLDDVNLTERLLEERPFLRPHADDQVIFRIQNGEATFWTSADSGRESALERIRF
jgi:pyridoxamine 5'-phosphate oxidase